MKPREAYEALYGPKATAVPETPEYRGGICADHGPVEIDQQARCVLCRQDTHVPGGGRAAEEALARHLVGRAHDHALAEDATRTIVRMEIVSAREVLAFRPRRSS